MENSKIEWTDHTFNPWTGCTKVSQGCKNCYAEALAIRYGTVKWGEHGTRVRTSKAYWKKPLTWNKKAKEDRIRYRVFCASMADVFEDRPELEEWRYDLFKLIKATPYLDWLLLTKRPDKIPLSLPFNVWVGTSVEDQETANERIPYLLRIPNVVRFISAEPLLGPIDLGLAANATYWDDPMAGIHWVIVGGESGKNARPIHPDWARGLRNQCLDVGIPFFFKQWGEWSPDCLCKVSHERKTTPRPIAGKSGVMFRCGKKNSGRLLDGREWNEMPDGLITEYSHLSRIEERLREEKNTEQK